MTVIVNIVNYLNIFTHVPPKTESVCFRCEWKRKFLLNDADSCKNYTDWPKSCIWWCLQSAHLHCSKYSNYWPPKYEAPLDTQFNSCLHHHNLPIVILLHCRRYVLLQFVNVCQSTCDRIEVASDETMNTWKSAYFVAVLYLQLKKGCIPIMHDF